MPRTCEKGCGMCVKGRTGLVMVNTYHPQRFALPEQRGVHGRLDAVFEVAGAQFGFFAPPDQPLPSFHGPPSQGQADRGVAHRQMSFEEQLPGRAVCKQEGAPLAAPGITSTRRSTIVCSSASRCVTAANCSGRS